MFQQNIPLSRHSNYKIGGNAKYFYEAGTLTDLKKALAKWGTKKSLFILGAGTNILFSDYGFEGLVLKPNFNYIKPIDYNRTTFSHSQECENVVVGSGTPISELLNYTITNGLSGLEWAGGLPGTLGGAIRGNAGCFGGEIKDVIQSVAALKIQNPKSKIQSFTNEQCNFGYRHSIFKESSDYIILEATLSLKLGNSAEIKKKIEDKIAYRNARHPMEYPSLGSVFKNVPVQKYPNVNTKAFRRIIKVDPFPVIPAAYLLSESGLKGISCGGAIISPKHPNFIVNAQSASASDVKNLIALAKVKVEEKFGVKLEEEIMIFKKS